MFDWDVPEWLVVLGAVLAGVVWVLDIGIRIAALGVIPGNRKPSTGVAWLLMVVLAPILGLIAFLLFGSTRVGRDPPREAAAGQRAVPRPARASARRSSRSRARRYLGVA